MNKEIFCKKLGFGFFISINKTEEQWLDNGKVVNFGTNFVRSEDLKSWSVGLITWKFYSLFGRTSC